jgi:hypothetical protein
MDGRDRGCENLLISGHFQPRAVNPIDKKRALRGIIGMSGKALFNFSVKIKLN